MHELGIVFYINIPYTIYQKAATGLIQRRPHYELSLTLICYLVGLGRQFVYPVAVQLREPRR